jgi:WD40 repeat protein
MSRGLAGESETSDIVVSAQSGFTSNYLGFVPVSLSRDGRVLLLGNEGTATAFDVTASLREIWRSAEIDALALAPEGRLVVGARTDGALCAWDLSTAKQAWCVDDVNPRVIERNDEDDEVSRPKVLSVTFTDNGQSVTVGMRDRTRRLFDAASGRELLMSVDASPAETSRTAPHAVSPDGTLRAAVDGEAVNITRVDGELLAQVRHDADPNPDRNGTVALAFSPDSRHLVTGSFDGSARVWDLAGQELAFIRHDTPVVAVAFNADGSRVVTASDDHSVQTGLWRDADLEHQFCNRLTVNLSADEWRTYFVDAPYAPTCERLPVREP